MIGVLPPFAVAPTPFRFPGLAALAGRAAIGGQREVALAAYLAARLAHDLVPDRELERDIRQERAGAAKNWLASMMLPPQIKPAVIRLIEATSQSRAAAAPALREMLAVSASQLDGAARLELEQLADALERR
jgi:hypothetical protein